MKLFPYFTSGIIYLLIEGWWTQQPYLHCTRYGCLARYVILRVAHAPGMPGTFSPLPLVCDPDMHHGTCVTHVPWCMPESLTTSFLWSRWRGKRSRHFRRMRNPQFYVFGKRPMVRNVHSACSDVEYAYYKHLSRKKDVALKDEDFHSIQYSWDLYSDKWCS